MQLVTAGGAALAVGGLAGYAAGIATSYPGRALSVTTVMVGIALLVFGQAAAGAEP